MINKKIASIVGASAMAVTLLAACGPVGETVTIKVWRPAEDKDVMNQIIENFKAANPGTNYNFVLQDVTEGSVKSEYEKKPADAADVMSLADDNLVTIMESGNVFAEIAGQYLTDLKADNTGWTVDAATLNGKVYGFPQASNGYFLYYNKQFLNETEASTLEGIFAKAKELGKKVYYPTAGWYAPGLLSGPDTDLSALTVNEEGKQVCTWDETKYVQYAEEVKTWFNTNNYKNVHVGVEDAMDGDFLSGNAIAVISGDWKYSSYLNGAEGKAGLGANLAAAKLPTLNGTQMRGFRGAKLVSVNAQSKVINEAVKFAAFSTNEQSQKLRFAQRSIAPSNKVAAASPEVAANIAAAALFAEQAYSYSQYAAVNGNFWTPAEICAKALFNGYTYWAQEGDSASAFISAQVAQMEA